MASVQEILTGWEDVIELIDSDKESTCGQLLYSIHICVLNTVLDDKILPIKPFPYDKFMQAMNNFCLKKLEIKNIILDNKNSSKANNQVVNVSTTIIGVGIRSAQNLGLIVKGDEALKAIEETFRENYISGSLIVAALRELLTYLNKKTFTKALDLDCSFTVEVLKSWTNTVLTKGIIKQSSNKN